MRSARRATALGRQPVDQDDEFLAAEAGDDPARRSVAATSREIVAGDALQHHVAVVVTVAVVDRA